MKLYRMVIKITGIMWLGAALNSTVAKVFSPEYKAWPEFLSLLIMLVAVKFFYQRGADGLGLPLAAISVLILAASALWSIATSGITFLNVWLPLAAIWVLFWFHKERLRERKCTN